MISSNARPCVAYRSCSDSSGKLVAALLISLCITSFTAAQSVPSDNVSPKESHQDFLQSVSASGGPMTDRYFILESQSTDETGGAAAGRPANQPPPQNIVDQPQLKQEMSHRRSAVLVRAVSQTLSHGPSIAHATDHYRSFSALPAPNEEKLAIALKQPLDLDFGNPGVTLGQFARLLHDKTDVPVVIDPYIVNEFAIDPNEPPFFTGSYEGIPLRAAIRRALSTYDELPLTLARRDGCILITEKTYAEQNYLPTRIYPVPFEPSTSLVTNVIQQTLSPTSWNTVGGQGAIMPSGNTLVISQTDEVHGEIEALLSQREHSLGIVPEHRSLRVHHLRDPEIVAFLATNLTGICNDALGETGDPQATVQAVASTLIIQSLSRPFLVYAEELVSCFQQREKVHYDWRAPFTTETGIQMLREESPDLGIGTNAGMGGGLF